MLRAIVLVGLMINPLLCICQDILGKWKGFNVITADQAMGSYDIELEIGIDSLGRYTAIMTNKYLKYFSTTALQGTFDKEKKLLVIKDSVLIETNFNPDSLIFEKYTLQLSKNGRVLIS